MLNKKIQVGNKIIEFDYDVKEIIEDSNLIIVLLYISYSDNELNNVFAYNKKGERLWRVNTRFTEHGINNKLPYEMIRIINGKLYATDFYGRRFLIDLKSGASISYDVVK